MFSPGDAPREFSKAITSLKAFTYRPNSTRLGVNKRFNFFTIDYAIYEKYIETGG